MENQQGKVCQCPDPDPVCKRCNLEVHRNQNGNNDPRPQEEPPADKLLLKIEDLEKVLNNFLTDFDQSEVRRASIRLCSTYSWLKGGMSELPKEANKSTIAKILCEAVWQKDVQPLLSLHELLCTGSLGAVISENSAASYKKILEQHKQNQLLSPVECTSGPGSPVLITDNGQPVCYGCLGGHAHSELELPT